MSKRIKYKGIGIKHRGLYVTPFNSPINAMFTCGDVSIPIAFVSYKFTNFSDDYIHIHLKSKASINDIEITRVIDGGTVRVVVPYVGLGDYFGNINLPFSMIMSEII